MAFQVQDTDVNPDAAPTLIVQNTPTRPYGTFSMDDNDDIVITSNPALLANPVSLVATFAHELTHYLTSTSPEEPPGGRKNWKFATAIAATFLGFGIFMANSCIHFSQYSQVGSIGWQSRLNRHFSESEHCIAFALFLHLKGISFDTA